MIRLLAHAKVNLCLEVLGRRDDGYHEVATVIQALALADELTVEPADSLILDCDDPSLNTPDNLALRAARLLQEMTDTTQGARIVLRKAIPVAAGLGGGSADAAAALVALNRLWNADLALENLSRFAASLGADVSFFLLNGGTAILNGGTAIATGRGDHVESLPTVPSGWAVLLVPNVPLPENKTAALYRLLGPERYTTGEHTRQWQERLGHALSWAELIAEPGFYNVFEPVAERAFPGIREAWGRFAAVVGGWTPIGLTGTGPTLYALFEQEGEASRVRAELRGLGLRALLTETVDEPLTLIE